MPSRTPHKLRLIFSTASSEEQAAAIANALVSEQLAACVNIVGPIRSIYRWREAIEGSRAGEARASPVAAALTDTIEKFRLPTKAFDDLLAAHVFDLYDDPMPDTAAFEGYCGETSSSLFRLAELVLSAGDFSPADAAGHAGVAYAATDILAALPIASARGQTYLPLDILKRNGVSREDMAARRDGAPFRAALGEMRELVRTHLQKALAAKRPGRAAAAFLPLALVPLALRRMERSDYRPFETHVETPQWRRQWALWRAARKY